MIDILKSIRWRKHRFSLIFLFLAIIIFSASIMEYRLTYLDKMDVEKRLRIQRNENNRVSQEISVFNEYYPTYVLAKNAGVVGDPQRLQWLEVLTREVEDIGIPYLDFTLDNLVLTQQDKDFQWSPNFIVFSTDLQLQMRILHEGDFYLLLTRLLTKAPGVFSINKCTLIRPGNDANSPVMAPLTVDCNLRWFTVSDSVIKEGNNE